MDEHIICETFHFECVHLFFHLTSRSTYGVHELKIFTFNDRELTRHFYFSYLFFACFGHFDFSPICIGRVYGARRARPHYPRTRVGFREFAKCTRAIKRECAREEDDGDGRCWITAATGIDVNENFLTTSAARLLPASRVTRTQCVTTRIHARALCRRVICIKAEARASV